MKYKHFFIITTSPISILGFILPVAIANGFIGNIPHANQIPIIIKIIIRIHKQLLKQHHYEELLHCFQFQLSLHRKYLTI